MARIKYYYDTETCKYERIKVSKWDIFLNSLGILSLSLVLAIGILFIASTYFESPQVSLLKKENQELLIYYDALHKDLSQMKGMVSSSPIGIFVPNWCTSSDLMGPLGPISKRHFSARCFSSLAC